MLPGKNNWTTAIEAVSLWLSTKSQLRLLLEVSKVCINRVYHGGSVGKASDS